MVLFVPYFGFTVASHELEQTYLNMSNYKTLTQSFIVFISSGGNVRLLQGQAVYLIYLFEHISGARTSAQHHLLGQAVASLGVSFQDSSRI